jgi:hypothetical protein
VNLIKTSLSEVECVKKTEKSVLVSTLISTDVKVRSSLTMSEGGLKRTKISDLL